MEKVNTISLKKILQKISTTKLNAFVDFNSFNNF